MSATVLASDPDPGMIKSNTDAIQLPDAVKTSTLFPDQEHSIDRGPVESLKSCDPFPAHVPAPLGLHQEPSTDGASLGLRPKLQLQRRQPPLRHHRQHHRLRRGLRVPEAAHADHQPQQLHRRGHAASAWVASVSGPAARVRAHTGPQRRGGGLVAGAAQQDTDVTRAVVRRNARKVPVPTRESTNSRMCHQFTKIASEKKCADCFKLTSTTMQRINYVVVGEGTAWTVSIDKDRTVRDLKRAIQQQLKFPFAADGMELYLAKSNGRCMTTKTVACQQLRNGIATSAEAAAAMEKYSRMDPADQVKSVFGLEETAGGGVVDMLVQLPQGEVERVKQGKERGGSQKPRAATTLQVSLTTQRINYVVVGEGTAWTVSIDKDRTVRDLKRAIQQQLKFPFAADGMELYLAKSNGRCMTTKTVACQQLRNGIATSAEAAAAMEKYSRMDPADQVKSVFGLEETAGGGVVDMLVQLPQGELEKMKQGQRVEELRLEKTRKHERLQHPTNKCEGWVGWCARMLPVGPQVYSASTLQLKKNV